MHARSRELRHDLRAVWLDGIAWALMVGMGETYFPAFALGLGVEPVTAGLVATVPMVLGSLVQLVVPGIVAAVRSHRRVVVACAALQAASLVSLAIGAWRGSLGTAWLYAWVSLYWAAGLGTAPAWNTWVETLVPARVRIQYFARRNRMLYVFQVVGVVAAGWMLQSYSRAGRPLEAFALAFAAAAVARGVSSVILSSQTEPTPVPAGMRRVSAREILARFAHGDDGRLLAAMLGVQLAAQVAVPFFTPYVLDGLGFSYAQYTVLLGAAVLARFVTLPALGRYARRKGLRALLAWGGVGVAAAAFAWAASPRFEWLLAAQLLAGTGFAAFEIASFLLVFRAVDLRERTSVLTTFYVAHSAATLAGSLIGAALLGARGATAAAFVAVFLASGVLRIVSLALVARARRESAAGLKTASANVR